MSVADNLTCLVSRRIRLEPPIASAGAPPRRQVVLTIQVHLFLP